MTKKARRLKIKTIKKGLAGLLILAMLLPMLLSTVTLQTYAQEGTLEEELVLLQADAQEGSPEEEFVLLQTDLELGKISLASSTPLAGQETAVTAVVSNAGDKTIGEFTAALFIDDATTPYAEQIIASLEPGVFEDVVFIWIPEEEGEYKLRAVADSTGMIYEADKINNELSILVNVQAAETDTNIKIDPLIMDLYGTLSEITDVCKPYLGMLFNGEPDPKYGEVFTNVIERIETTTENAIWKVQYRASATDDTVIGTLECIPEATAGTYTLIATPSEGHVFAKIIRNNLADGSITNTMGDINAPRSYPESSTQVHNKFTNVRADVLYAALFFSYAVANEPAGDITVEVDRLNGQGDALQFTISTNADHATAFLRFKTEENGPWISLQKISFTGSPKKATLNIQYNYNVKVDTQAGSPANRNICNRWYSAEPVTFEWDKENRIFPAEAVEDGKDVYMQQNPNNGTLAFTAPMPKEGYFFGGFQYWDSGTGKWDYLNSKANQTYNPKNLTDSQGNEYRGYEFTNYTVVASTKYRAVYFSCKIAESSIYPAEAATGEIKSTIVDNGPQIVFEVPPPNDGYVLRYIQLSYDGGHSWETTEDIGDCLGFNYTTGGVNEGKYLSAYYLPRENTTVRAFYCACEVDEDEPIYPAAATDEPMRITFIDSPATLYSLAPTLGAQAPATYVGKTIVLHAPEPKEGYVFAGFEWYNETTGRWTSTGKGSQWKVPGEVYSQNTTPNNKRTTCKYRTRYVKVAVAEDSQPMKMGTGYSASGSYSVGDISELSYGGATMSFTVPEGKAIGKVEYKTTRYPDGEAITGTLPDNGYMAVLGKDEYGNNVVTGFSCSQAISGDTEFKLTLVDVHVETDYGIEGNVEYRFNDYNPAEPTNYTNIGRYVLTARPSDDYVLIKWQKKNSADGEWENFAGNTPATNAPNAPFAAITQEEAWYRAVFATGDELVNGELAGGEITPTTNNEEGIIKGKVLKIPQAEPSANFWLKAVPLNGYVFSHWENVRKTTGVVSKLTNEATMSVTPAGLNNYNYHAVFAKVGFYEGEGSTVGGTFRQYVDYTGSVILEAVPEAGYGLAGWYYIKELAPGSGDYEDTWVLDTSLKIKAAPRDPIAYVKGIYDYSKTIRVQPNLTENRIYRAVFAPLSFYIFKSGWEEKAAVQGQVLVYPSYMGGSGGSEIGGTNSIGWSTVDSSKQHGVFNAVAESFTVGNQVSSVPFTATAEFAPGNNDVGGERDSNNYILDGWNVNGHFISMEDIMSGLLTGNDSSIIGDTTQAWYNRYPLKIGELNVLAYWWTKYSGSRHTINDLEGSGVIVNNYTTEQLQSGGGLFLRPYFAGPKTVGAATTGYSGNVVFEPVFSAKVGATVERKFATNEEAALDNQRVVTAAAAAIAGVDDWTIAPEKAGDKEDLILALEEKLAYIEGVRGVAAFITINEFSPATAEDNGSFQFTAELRKGQGGTYSSVTTAALGGAISQSLPGADGLIKVIANDASRGSVSVLNLGNNVYRLTASGNYGSPFLYWERTAGHEITEDTVFAKVAGSDGSSTLQIMVESAYTYRAVFKESTLGQVVLGGGKAGIARQYLGYPFKLANPQESMGGWDEVAPPSHPLTIKMNLEPRGSNAAKMFDSFKAGDTDTWQSEVTRLDDVPASTVPLFSESVKEGDPVVLQVPITYYGAISEPVEIAFYAGNFAAETPNEEALLFKDILPGDNFGALRGHAQSLKYERYLVVPVDAMPYTNHITVTLKVGENGDEDDEDDPQLSRVDLKQVYQLNANMEASTEDTQAYYTATKTLADKYQELCAPMAEASWSYRYGNKYLMMNEEFMIGLRKLAAAEKSEYGAIVTQALRYMEDAAGGRYHSGVKLGQWSGPSDKKFFVSTVPAGVNIVAWLMSNYETVNPGNWRYNMAGAAWSGPAQLQPGDTPGLHIAGKMANANYRAWSADGPVGFLNAVTIQNIGNGWIVGGGFSGPSPNAGRGYQLTAGAPGSLSWDLAVLMEQLTDEELAGVPEWQAAVDAQYLPVSWISEGMFGGLEAKNYVLDPAKPEDAQAKKAWDDLRMAIAQGKFGDILFKISAEAKKVIDLIEGLKITSPKEELLAVYAEYEKLDEATKSEVFNFDALKRALFGALDEDESIALRIDFLIDGIGYVSYSDLSRTLIADAEKSYNDASASVKEKVVKHDDLIAKRAAFDALAQAKIDDANTKIAAIPEINQITIEAEPSITAARAAYDALLSTEQSIIEQSQLVKLVNAETKLISVMRNAVDTIRKNALLYLQTNVQSPTVGSQKGEWTVLALSRALEEDGVAPSDPWKSSYLRALDLALANNVLGLKTDWERVTLALSALGIDASEYKGASGAAAAKDLTAAYKTYVEEDGETLNNKIFALLALNSKPYGEFFGTEETKYVTAILESESVGGGWNLYADREAKADVDMTAMALQALAPYYADSTYGQHEPVKAAVDSALELLSTMQDSKGGFSSFGDTNSESPAQVIVALAELGIDAQKDKRFIKEDGYNPLSNLLSYYDEAAGGFRHVIGGGANQMATEQAAYALVAYNRLLNGKQSLYDMSGVFDGTDISTRPPATIEVDKTALNAAISAAPEKQGNNSPSKWLVLQNKLTVAIETRDNPDATQAMVDFATNALNEAIAAFNEQVPPDPDTPGVEDGVKVTFRLIGATEAADDIDLSNGNYNGAEYVTWIKTTTYTLPEDSTNYDLFVTALGDAGLTAVGHDSNYIKTIYAPASLGGKPLSEFTNGHYSGWMYTVNGKHPGVGLQDSKLHNGDKIIWHYVNDYRHEVSDWFNDPDFPALGDGRYHSKWLEASDTAPTPGSIVPGAGSGGAGNQSADAFAVAPKVTAKGGKAEVAMNQDDMNTIIAETKKNNRSSIVIKPEITGGANIVSLQLPKTSISSLVSETQAFLKVETPVGTITLPQEVLTAITSQASGDTVTMGLEAVKVSTLTQTQQAMVGDRPVYDVTIKSGNSFISSFNGKNITISLPYTLRKGESAADVKVWYLNDAGELEQVGCAYDEKTGLVTFKTDHLSYYLVGMEIGGKGKEKDGFTLNFTDVKSGDWYFEAVKYAVRNGLFVGTGDTTFSPNEPMTRAMLVTVLHRLEGSPATTGTNRFTDVKDGEWYAKAVLWANANDIVSGYGNSLFGPGDPITREQMASILYRYATSKGYDLSAAANLKAYTDAAGISSWAQTALGWASATDLITGRTATTLVPAGNATRAEVASILMRFVEGFVG